MRRRGSVLTVVLVALASLTSTAGVSARSYVDPTTLTPPLKPFRVCWQLGPNVQCDTSGVTSYENLATDESPCGLIYETATEDSNSTRWYRDGLLVRRAVEESVKGTWSLSPTGAGPTVAFARNVSWDEEFTVPGDIDSSVSNDRGATLRVPALGSDLHDTGIWVPDGTHHGLVTYTDEAAARLCSLLVG
jgi:hypothetical protein